MENLTQEKIYKLRKTKSRSKKDQKNSQGKLPQLLNEINENLEELEKLIELGQQDSDKYNDLDEKTNNLIYSDHRILISPEHKKLSERYETLQDKINSPTHKDLCLALHQHHDYDPSPEKYE